MREVFLIILFAGCVSCSSPESEKLASEFEMFNQFIGPQKAEALDLAVDSFNEFLKYNYRTSQNYQDRIISFIHDLYDNDFKPLNHWKVDILTSRDIIEKFESSDLRKDFWKYGYESINYDEEVIGVYQHISDSLENYFMLKYPNTTIEDLELDEDDIPLTRPSSMFSDSILEIHRIEDSIDYANGIHSVEYSRFYVGLYKFQKSDTIIQAIAFSNIYAGPIGPYLKAEWYLKMNDFLDYSNPLMQRIIVCDFYYPFVL